MNAATTRPTSARSTCFGFRFLGTIEQRTDQDRIPTPTRARDIVRADISANDFQVRATGERASGRRAVEFGADINGRYGLEAHDILILYDLAGNIVSKTDNCRSIRPVARTMGVFAGRRPRRSKVTVSGGIRGDYVSNVNEGGYFGDRSMSTARSPGSDRVDGRPVRNVTLTAQISRGFRDPTLSDRFFRGPNGRGFITGNPDLEPETSLQGDFGIRYATGQLRRPGTSTSTGSTISSNGSRPRRTSSNSAIAAARGSAASRSRRRPISVTGSRSRSPARSAAASLDDDGAARRHFADQFSFSFAKPSDRSSRRSSRVCRVCRGRPARTERNRRAGPHESRPGRDLASSKHLEVRGSHSQHPERRSYYASPDPRFVLAPGVNGFVTVPGAFLAAAGSQATR